MSEIKMYNCSYCENAAEMKTDEAKHKGWIEIFGNTFCPSCVKKNPSMDAVFNAPEKETKEKKIFGTDDSKGHGILRVTLMTFGWLAFVVGLVRLFSIFSHPEIFTSTFKAMGFISKISYAFTATSSMIISVVLGGIGYVVCRERGFPFLVIAGGIAIVVSLIRLSI